MRIVLLVLALVVLVAIGLVWANVIDIDWNGDARSPVGVQVNPVEVGTTTRNVQIETPTVTVRDSNPPPANVQ